MEQRRFPKIEKYYSSLDIMLEKFDARSGKDKFKGSNLSDFIKWQNESRNLLVKLLGLDRMEKSDLCSSVAETQMVPISREENAKEIKREKVFIQTESSVYMPMYILIPDGKIKGVVICPHGHQGGGKITVAGDYRYESVKERIDRFNYDYGMQYAKEGFVAVCPDSRGFGERRDLKLQADNEGCFFGCSCNHLAHMAEPLGETVAGMLTFDLMCLIDYLFERNEWPLDKLAISGFSGGGMQALYLSALDARVKTTVISGYMYGFRDSLLELNGNCGCNYIPHLWEHFDMGDIASLIAPRNLIIQSCREDHLGGKRGLDNALEQVDIIRNAYAIFDKDNKLMHDICEGPHAWHDERIDEYCSRIMKG